MEIRIIIKVIQRNRSMIGHIPLSVELLITFFGAGSAVSGMINNKYEYILVKWRTIPNLKLWN